MVPVNVNSDGHTIRFGCLGVEAPKEISSCCCPEQGGGTLNVKLGPINFKLGPGGNDGITKDKFLEK